MAEREEFLRRMHVIIGNFSVNDVEHYYDEYEYERIEVQINECSYNKIRDALNEFAAEHSKNSLDSKFKITQYIVKQYMKRSILTCIIYTDALYHKVILGQNIFLPKISLSDLRNDFTKLFPTIVSNDLYDIKLVFNVNLGHDNYRTLIQNYYNLSKYLKFTDGVKIIDDDASLNHDTDMYEIFIDLRYVYDHHVLPECKKE